MFPSVSPSSGDRALSPVMATIFMIGVAVIAVGTVGILVLDIGNQVQEPPPAAAFSFSYTQNETGGDELLITHVSGDELPKETIEVRAMNVDIDCEGCSDMHYDEYIVDWSELSFGDQSSGDTVALTDVRDEIVQNEGYAGHEDRFHLDLDEATIRIVWKGGAGSVIVDEWSGPDA